jgi:hypothetical protein
MVSIGRCLAAVVLALTLGACKKNGGSSTTPSGGDGGGGGGGATSDKPSGGGAGDDKPAADGGGGGEKGGAGGPMGPAAFCQTYGEKAKKEGGKAADFWERNYGKDCEKKLTAEKKKQGDAKWNEFVSCAQGQSTAADAFDECEL